VILWSAPSFGPLDGDGETSASFLIFRNLCGVIASPAWPVLTRLGSGLSPGSSLVVLFRGDVFRCSSFCFLAGDSLMEEEGGDDASISRGRFRLLPSARDDSGGEDSVSLLGD